MAVESFFARALACQLDGRLAEAEAGYRAMRPHIEPANPAVEFNLGIVLRQLRRLEEAVDAYRLALALRSIFPEAHNNLETLCLPRTGG